MKDFLWQKYILDSYDSQSNKYMFSFDLVSCKTTREARRVNPNYVVLNIQRN